MQHLWSALLTYYYNQESAVNAQVKTLHHEAEQAALNGKYAEAIKLLDKALGYRPNVEALVQDRQITAKAYNLFNQMDEAAGLLKTGKLSKRTKSFKRQRKR